MNKGTKFAASRFSAERKVNIETILIPIWISFFVVITLIGSWKVAGWWVAAINAPAVPLQAVMFFPAFMVVLIGSTIAVWLSMLLVTIIGLAFTRVMRKHRK